MKLVYSDTSFLFSLYAFDANGKSAVATYERLGGDVAFVYSRFHDLELRTALRVAVHRQEFTETTLKQIFRDIESDRADDTLAEHKINWTSMLARAAELSDTYAAALGSRSLDILHVALALDLRTDIFLTFDADQGVLATKAGLKVLP